jgi:hypothetical protein
LDCLARCGSPPSKPDSGRSWRSSPAPRSGPSPARYLLLAANHRICQPGPKTEVADWYGRTILHSVWGIPPERFTPQALLGCF